MVSAMGIPASTHPSRPALRVIGGAALNTMLVEQDRQVAEARKKAEADDMAVMSDLSAYVTTKYGEFANHRTSNAGWAERMLKALRVFNGVYDPTKLAAIKMFGGSEVYARMIAMKCRGATSLLRDVYLSPDKAWGIGPPADPDVPEEVKSAIQQLVIMEMYTLSQAGQKVDEGAARDRAKSLFMAAREVEKKNAARRTKVAEDKIEEIFQEGGLYMALAEFLVDLPLFPFACIKGPEVKVVPTVVYEKGRAVTKQLPKLSWSRVSPFDLYWTPGASTITEADVIERTRITRADLNDCLDLPGYNHQAVENVLTEYGAGGIADNWDFTDTERALYENRENPRFNRSGMMNTLKFSGNIQGSLLLDYGMTDPAIVAAPLRDYNVQLWMIGKWVIKCQMTPSPRKRHEYYITSFEKVPGTPVGNGLPDILSDIEDVSNATLRTLVNNLSISSGPQVVIMDDRLAPGENGEQIFPWKRWHVQSDPASANAQQQPVYFFQPESHAQELLGIYEKFNAIADEISAIPKYLSGQGMGSGAGRTASGLAMLMGNANKILQTVAANIDRDIFDPLLNGTFDMLMLTDESGMLQGDENIQVKGVNVAIQRETERSRQLEFLQITGNPIDQPILGIKGRATVLRAVANSIGLDGQEVVPSDEQIDAVMQQQAMQAAGAQPGPAAPAQNPSGEPVQPDPNASPDAGGGQPQSPDATQQPPQQVPQGGGVNGDMGPRTQIAGGVG